MKISNEIKFGILAILAIVLFIVGMNYMRGSKIFGNPYILYAEYAATEGLIKGNPINISGLKMGKVSSLDLDMKTSKVVAALEFDSYMDIPVDSKAIIYNSDLLGSKAVRIELGDSTRYIPHTGRIKGKLETSLVSRVQEELQPIKDAVTSLILQIDSTIQWTNLTLSETGSRAQIGMILHNISQSAANIKDLTVQVSDVVASVNKLTGSATSVVSNIDDNKGNINKVMDNVAASTDSIKAATSQIQDLISDAENAVKGLDDVVARLNSEDSSIGLLLNDRELYDNINGSVTNVKELIDAIKKNPKKYLDVDVYVFERKKKAAPKE